MMLLQILAGFLSLAVWIIPNTEADALLDLDDLAGNCEPMDRGTGKTAIANHEMDPSTEMEPTQGTDLSPLRVMIRPIPTDILAPKSSVKVTLEFIGKYYESVHRWGGIVRKQLQPVPGHPDWYYLGLPQHTEDDVRPTAYSAMVLGFLAKYQPPHMQVEPSDRDRWRESAIGLLRYLTSSHISGGGACLNGQSWGNQWQSAMWARAVGMAGWFLWDDLDEDLQTAVARLIEFEADRFLHKAPRSSLDNNTGAEENAWNALVTSLACHMMPTHPRAKTWEESSLCYMYNSFSIAADTTDTTPGDWGRPVKDWVTTINAHDDFTVENHGMVHMGYLKNTASELQECVLPWLITRQKVPEACMHHIPEVFELLIDCMAWDGGPVYFAGTDWKIYHEQACEAVLYAMLSLLKADRRAAFLEWKAVEWIARQQQAEEGYYNVRRDLEYGGLCATRLIVCCLAHGIVNASPEPITADAFDRLATGTRQMTAGKAVVHRTPTKFTSFAWAQKRMALALPRDGTWVIWPHFASYLGMVNGHDSSHRHARLDRIQLDVRPDGFEVTGTLLRCKTQLVHDFYFASPPGDYAVYFERLAARGHFQLDSRETGVIGLEYPLGSNHCLLHGPWGTRTTTAYGGQAKIDALEGNWLNIDGRVGYVVVRSDGQRNIMHYHDENQGIGRVPQLQEWISLVGETGPISPSAADGACVVTFLNQPAQETARWVERVQLQLQDNETICRIGDDVIKIDLPAIETKINQPQPSP
ncbi:MAG: hypothetical protein JW829_14870 [Pirellulales bacterium]|nr:hypothetical protein [Pirellulales bacterium]